MHNFANLSGGGERKKEMYREEGEGRGREKKEREGEEGREEGNGKFSE